MLKLLLGVVLLSCCLCDLPIDIAKFPCHDYLSIMNNKTGYFKGVFSIPMTGDRSKYSQQRMTLSFNKPVRTFMVEGARFKTDNYKVFEISMEGMKGQIAETPKDKSFPMMVTVSVHGEEFENNIGVSTIHWGGFQCGMKPLMRLRSFGGAPEKDCTKYVKMVDYDYHGGYVVELDVPVTQSSSKYDLDVGFSTTHVTGKLSDGSTGTKRANKHCNSFSKSESLVSGKLFKTKLTVNIDKSFVTDKKDVNLDYIKFNRFQCGDTSLCRT